MGCSLARGNVRRGEVWGREAHGKHGPVKKRPRSGLWGSSQNIYVEAGGSGDNRGKEKQSPKEDMKRA